MSLSTRRSRLAWRSKLCWRDYRCFTVDGLMAVSQPTPGLLEQGTSELLLTLLLHGYYYAASLPFAHVPSSSNNREGPSSVSSVQCVQCSAPAGGQHSTYQERSFAVLFSCRGSWEPNSPCSLVVISQDMLLTRQRPKRLAFVSTSVFQKEREETLGPASRSRRKPQPIGRLAVRLPASSEVFNFKT